MKSFPFIKKFQDNNYLSSKIILSLDLFVSCCSSMIALFVAGILFPPRIANGNVLILWMLGSLVFSFVFFLLLKTHKSIIRHSTLREQARIVASSFFKGVSIYLMLVLIPSVTISLRIIGTICFDVLITVTALILMRICMTVVYTLIQRNRRRSSSKTQRILICGTGSKGVSLVTQLQNSKTDVVVGFISYGKKLKNQELANQPIYYFDDKSDVEYLRAAHSIDAILFAHSRDARNEQDRLVRYCIDCKIRILIAPSISEAVDGKLNLPGIREVKIEDLLGREEIQISIDRIQENFSDKVVMVTGAAGSIGSELCRQIAKLEPRRLIIVDIYENNAYDIEQELRREYGKALDLVVEIASVRDKTRMECIFKHYRPQVVFHAAAHKHVPLMEHSACEVVKNNVMGTYNVADVAEAFGTEKFVLISTDKAVNPTNVMGASKRMCEMIVQCRTDSQTAFTAVRFGNVLGSNGSVIPLFQRQISAGGPVTVTDKRIIRYFMTIAEASCLVLTAGAMAKDGELFVLDMGTEMKIWTLAENLIRLMGYRPHEDIQIVETGLRPGEKLYEETLTHSESATKTENELIYIEKDIPLSRAEVDQKIDLLLAAVKEAEGDITSEPVKAALHRVIPTFKEPDEVNKNVNKEKLNALSGVQN